MLATLYFLSEHGYLVERCGDDEMYEFTRRLAAHEIAEDRREEVPAVAEWLERNARKQQKGDKQMKLGPLREALARSGFELDDLGKTLRVLKGGQEVATILKRGAQGFEDYGQVYIADLRKRLGLTAEEGVDSARFYGQKGITEELNQFMQMRIEVMQRLART